MPDQAAEGILSPFLRAARFRAAVGWLRGRVLDIGCGSGGLATFIGPTDYVGFDRDPDSLEAARRDHPQHRFVSVLPEDERFDTVVALALIEHLPQPEDELRRWRDLLVAGGQLVLTTPHKMFRLVHDTGAKIGIFSATGAAEHETMFDRRSLTTMVQTCGFDSIAYRRFLLGANQLLVARTAHQGPRRRRERSDAS